MNREAEIRAIVERKARLLGIEPNYLMFKLEEMQQFAYVDFRRALGFEMQQQERVRHIVKGWRWKSGVRA